MIKLSLLNELKNKNYFKIIIDVEEFTEYTSEEEV